MRAAWMKTAIQKQTRRECFPERLLLHINKMKEEQVIPHVLDVGCGPLSPLAWGAETNLFDFVAVDPLADVYQWLLKLYRIDFPVKPIRCSAENLLDIFQPKSFDVVYSRNALDHVHDAHCCIANIRKVLKKSGRFYFDGITKEGSRQHWRGLHKHDFFISEGNLLWSSKDGAVKNFSKEHGLTLLYQNQPHYNTGDWFRAEFQKVSY